MSYRSLCVASLFFAVLFVLVPSVPARGQSDTLFRPQIVHADSVDFRSIRATMHPVTQNYPEKMELIVSIRNAAGHMVAGLAPPFAHSEDHRGFWTSLVEEGAAGHTAIEEFSVEEIRSGVAERPAIVLVLDYSGSMSQDYQFMEQGARIGAFAVDSTFPIAVVKFDHTVSVAHAMGDSNYYPRTTERPGSVACSRSTAYCSGVRIFRHSSSVLVTGNCSVFIRSVIIRHGRWQSA